MDFDVAKENGMIHDQQRSSIMRSTASVVIYTLVCTGVGYAAFALVHQHVTTHRVPSAFGLEYLIVFLPFLVAAASFPFLPFIAYSLSKLLFRAAQNRLISPAILAASVIFYGVALTATGFFFTWARQQ